MARPRALPGLLVELEPPTAPDACDPSGVNSFFFVYD